MEWIGSSAFDRAEDVSRWFSAAGALLCVAHLLRASDLHFDNVLVGPASPVLVDLETLMHPEPASGAAADGQGTAAARVAGWMRASFQSTGMLSFLQQGPDGAVIDIGGLCGVGGHALADEATEAYERARERVARWVDAPVRRRAVLHLPEPLARAAVVADLEPVGQHQHLAHGHLVALGRPAMVDELDAVGGGETGELRILGHELVEELPELASADRVDAVRGLVQDQRDRLVDPGDQIPGRGDRPAPRAVPCRASIISS